MTERGEIPASPAAAWTLAITATLGVSVSYVDRQTLAAIAPSVTGALHIDNTHFGWLLAAFSTAYFLASPLAGSLVDRVGARRGLALAVLVWSIVAGLHALAFSFATLFLLRVLLGVTESPSLPAATQAMRRALPSARRPLALGIMFAGSSLGALAANKVGVALDARYGFRAAFLLVAVVGFAWLPVWFFASRGFRLDAEPKLAKTSPRSYAILRTAPVIRAVVATLGAAPPLMFVQNWGSKYLVDHWHMPKSAIGNILVIGPLVFDAGAITFGALAAARKSTSTPVGLLLAGMALQASIAFAPFAPSPVAGIVMFGVSAAGGACINTLVLNDLLARVPVERTSVASGILAAAQSLGYLVGGPLVGLAIDKTGGYTLPVVAVGLLVPPTLLAFLFWPGVPRTPPIVPGTPT